MAKLAPQGPFRAFDNNGDPLSGGLLYTYEAGTTTNKDTYTDEGEGTTNANPVVLDSNGYADVWLGSGTYKFVLKDSGGTELWTVDDVVGQGATGFLSSVVTQTTGLNLTASYKDNLICCTSAVGITLLSAVTAQEGFAFVVKNDSSGDVTVTPDGSETIDGSATKVLSPSESATIVSDGTNWKSFGSLPDDIILTAMVKDGQITGDKMASNTINASNLNSDAKNSPSFRATRTSNQSISTATETKVQFDTEVFDTDSCYDNSTNYRFTPTVSGKYLVTTKVTFGIIAAGVNQQVQIRKNGTTVDVFTRAAGGNVTETVQVTCLVDMNGSSDYLEVYCYHENGSNVNIGVASSATSDQAGTTFESFRLII